MPLPTPEQFLAKLAASPADAAAFDKFAGGKTRREAVEATLTAVTATITANAASKAKVAASKAKVAALEKAKLTNQRLRTSLAATKALVSAKQARRPAQPESAAATYSRLSRTDPIAAHKFYQENRLAILNPTPTH
jgi:hypothetical protein